MKSSKIFRWSSHQPLLKSAIKLLDPNLIVELGTGHFSTSIINQSSAEKIIHIENDQQWLETVEKENMFTERNDLRHHFLGQEITKQTHLTQISETDKNNISNYYHALKSEVLSLPYTKRLLFVDQYTCARSISINVLYDAFDIIIYHDAESPELYSYNFNINDYEYYIFQPNSTFTGIFFKKTIFDLSRFIEILDSEFVLYLKEKKFEEQTYQFIKI